MTDDKVILTVADLCARWQCKRGIIVGAIRTGALASFKLGKRAYRFTLAAVEQYEAANQIPRRVA